MSDTKETTNEKTSENTEPHFSIEKIYLKDVSFESPAAPAVFTDDWSPEINMDLNSTGKPIDNNIFEVELSITVTAKNKDKTGFLVEIKQCGIFSISGMDEANLNGMLGSFCPNILFPYAREAISDLVSKGGFPQLLLAPVNFDAIYAQHLQNSNGETIN
ncbi:MAG: protein-export chaperone SecB [Gammaproteobacteria bacterium]|nr:protein-export chaperone SecB [Gammaproteobacteria bacterium]